RHRRPRNLLIYGSASGGPSTGTHSYHTSIGVWWPPVRRSYGCADGCPRCDSARHTRRPGDASNRVGRGGNAGILVGTVAHRIPRSAAGVVPGRRLAANVWHLRTDPAVLRYR